MKKKPLSWIERGPRGSHTKESKAEIMRIVREEGSYLPAAAQRLGYKSGETLYYTLYNFYGKHPLLKEGVNLIRELSRRRHKLTARNIVATVLANYCYLKDASSELGYGSVETLEVTMSQLYSEFPETETSPGLKKLIQRNREVAIRKGYRD